MPNVSSEFRRSVKNGNKQRILLLFGMNDGVVTSETAVFTNEDIDIDSGVRFQETINPDTDITFGACPCSTLSFTALNEARSLTNYSFGEFEAKLGVVTSKRSISNRGVTCVAGGYTVNYDGSRLYVNGQSVTSAGSAKIGAIAVLGDIAYLCSKTGSVVGYNLRSGSVVSAPINAFMRSKAAEWAEHEVGVYYADNVCTITKNKVCETYEFCHLGIFKAEKPKVMNKDILTISAKDRMSYFDVPAPQWEWKTEGKDEKTGKKTYTYNNIGLKQMLDDICKKAGVEYILPTNTRVFTDDASIRCGSTEKDYKLDSSVFKNVTCRDVLGWLAEADTKFAKVNREGVLQFIDLNQGSQVSLSEHDYSNYEQYWYAVKRIDKIVVRDSGFNDDYSYGEGENAYLIENNPIVSLWEGTQLSNKYMYWKDDKDKEQGEEGQEQEPEIDMDEWAEQMKDWLTKESTEDPFKGVTDIFDQTTKTLGQLGYGEKIPNHKDNDNKVELETPDGDFIIDANDQRFDMTEVPDSNLGKQQETEVEVNG